MVVKPQKTKFQLKIVENIQTLSIWANNPWRRYSISLIILLIGYFFGSSLGMVSAVVELMDPVAAFLSVVFIEVLIVLRRNYRFERKKKFLVLLLDSLRLGLFYEKIFLKWRVFIFMTENEDKLLNGNLKRFLIFKIFVFLKICT